MRGQGASIVTQNCGEVRFAGEQTASTLLYELIALACEQLPDLKGVAASEAKFRNSYAVELPRVEAARLASSERYDIARQMLTALYQNIVWYEGGVETPLLDALGAPNQALTLREHTFEAPAGWRPNVVYRGDRWEGQELEKLAERLVSRRVITDQAGAQLKAVVNQHLVDGRLDLSGRKIVVFGGGAEMAPTRLWLEAGATVLWFDVQPPPTSWWETSSMSGRLFWPEDGADLLTQPREILATLISFAQGEPLDLGLYAYAPGQARELRLTATMNAIVEALPNELIRTVTMLVSPTTPTALSQLDLEACTERLVSMPKLELFAKRLGLFGSQPGYSSFDDTHVTNTVVSIQGASYQAAQYIGKILASELWAYHGRLDNSEQPLRVSANSAAITKTRSLAHPVFAAAFGGAEALGVETFAPRLSRRINGLLSVADWLQPELPVPGAVRVHGGIHTLPYPLEAGLRIAAGMGFARSPRLIGGLFKR